MNEINKRRQAVLRMLNRGDPIEKIQQTAEYRLLMDEDIPWLLALAES